MSYQSEVLADAPVAYYRLQEASTADPVIDSSGQGRDGAFGGLVSGILTQQPSLIAEPGDYSIKVDEGVSNTRFIQTPAFAIASGKLTLEVLVKTTDTAALQQLISRDDSTGIRRYQFRIVQGRVELVFWTATAGPFTCQTAVGAVTANAPHHLAATYDGTVAKIYVNGVEKGSLTQAGTLHTDSVARYVAARRQTFTDGEQPRGWIDEPAIYDKALTAARIAAHYAAATGAAPANVNVAAPLLTGSGAAPRATVSATSALDVTVTAPTLTGDGSLPEPAASTGRGTVVDAPTLPALGEVLDPTVTATSSTNDVTVTAPALTGTGALPRPTAVTGGTELLAGGFAFGGSLTSDAIDLAPQHLEGGFVFGSRLTSIAVAAQHALAGGFKIGGRIRQAQPWGVDPRTGRPEVKVVIVDRNGKHITGLGGFQLAPLKDGVGVGDEWGITVARDDANARKILPVAHEAQLWRGGVLMTRGPIGPGRADGGRISYSCSDPSWLMRGQRRVIGRVPKRQLLRNPGFTEGADGLAYWKGGWDTGSALEAPPTVRVVDDPQALSGKALEIGAVDKVVTTKEDVETSAVFVPNQSTYLSGGEQKIKDVGAKIPNGSVVRITGFTANDGTGDGLNLSLRRAQAAKATLAAMGKGFIFKLPDPLRSPNQNDGTVAGRGYYEQIPGGLKPNRRVNIAYEGAQTAVGHRQYEWQIATITHPASERVPLALTFAGEMKIIRWDGAPKDGWAARLIVYPAGKMGDKDIVSEGTVDMDESTPRVLWAPYSTSVKVPPDGKPYDLVLRFYPPAGLARWANVGLWPEDQLGFFDVDQALIVKGLVEHVQDPTMGKGDLGIKTRTPLTGIPRTKEYPFHERMPVETALEWFESIDRGLDIDCEVTETTATIVTHYPRQGSSSDLALVHGGSRSNIKGYKPLSTSPADLASSIIMQADGSGASRPEAYARDAKALGGTLLEAVISAEEETPLSELDEGAVAALRQSLHPRAGWEVTLDPAVTTEALDAIGKGDTVRLVLPDEGIDAPHRMVLRQWDPATDVLTLTLVPEED